jgi:hypothetical protein
MIILVLATAKLWLKSAIDNAGAITAITPIIIWIIDRFKIGKDSFGVDRIFLVV